MSAESIHVIAKFQAIPGHAEAVTRILLGLIEPTRREKGCVRYELVQSTTDPGELIFVEEWASAADLEAHLATPHVAAAASAVLPLLNGPFDIRRYQQVG